MRILVASGKRIQAIKELREVTDLGLREAKEYVDKMIGQ
ncbi:ribosomal protein L7/L12 [Paenibacillus sp. MCAF20]